MFVIICSFVVVVLLLFSSLSFIENVHLFGIEQRYKLVSLLQISSSVSLLIVKANNFLNLFDVCVCVLSC